MGRAEDSPSGGSRGQPRTAVRSRGQPRAAVSSRGQPKAAEGSLGQPRAVEGSRGQPRAAAGSRGQPWAAEGSREQLPLSCLAFPHARSHHLLSSLPLYTRTRPPTHTVLTRQVHPPAPARGWLVGESTPLLSTSQPRAGGPASWGPLWGGWQDRARVGGAWVGVTSGFLWFQSIIPRLELERPSAISFSSACSSFSLLLLHCSQPADSDELPLAW